MSEAIFDRVIKEDLSEKVTFLQRPDSVVGAGLGKRWRKNLVSAEAMRPEEAGQLKEQKEDPLWLGQSE